MRRIARLLPYLGLVLVVAVVVALFWRTGPLRQQLRSAITNELARQTNRQVSVGDVTLSPTGRIVLHDLVVRNRDGSALLTAPETSVRLGRLRSLVSPSSSAAVLRAVTLRRPEVNLTREASGRWSIQDLLARRPKGAARFQGDIFVEQGRVTVVDRVHGLTTTLEGLDLEIRQPRQGQVSFSARARGADNAFDSLEATGSSEDGGQALSVSGRITGLDLGYASARLPSIPGLKVSAGRADIKGELALGATRSGGAESGYRVEAEVTGGEVSFPWLRRPVTAVKGRVRLAGGDVHLEEITGECAGAPVRVNGVIVGLRDPKLAIDVSATGLRFQQLNQLLPKLYVPLTLTLPSPVRVTARVEGPARDVSVSGRAEVRVMKFRLLPWHDVVATFSYHQRELKIESLRAHGSPRRLEANIEMKLGRRPEIKARFSLTEVPVSTVAEMLGLAGVDLQGTASVSGEASLATPQSFQGRFTIRNAVTRGLPLGLITGEFEYSDRRVLIRRARIRGPMVQGELSGRVTLPDRYELAATFSRIDLSALGREIGKPNLSGQFPGTARASGAWRAGQSSGLVAIGPGRLQGRALQSLAARFELSPQQLRVSDVVMELARGSYQGGLEIAGWQGQGARQVVSGRFQFRGAAPGDWLPPPYGWLIGGGSVDGSAEIAGTIVDPRLQMDLQVNSVQVDLPWAGRWEFATGAAQLRYQSGSFLIDRLELRERSTGLSISGTATPGALSLELSGDQVDLAKLPTGTGPGQPALTGRAQVLVKVTGSWQQPQVDFKLAANAVTIRRTTFSGLIAFEQIALEGRYRRGVLELARASVNQPDSALSITGSVDLERPEGEVDLSIAVKDIDLFRAIWRLDQFGINVYRLIPFRNMPPLVGGWLNDSRRNADLSPIRITGTTRDPRVEVPLALDELSFGGGEIGHIGGVLAVSLHLEHDRSASLRKLEVVRELRATHGPAFVSVKEGGHVSPEGNINLSVEVGNLDLELLAPWLHSRAVLNGLGLGGRAHINFDVTGEAHQPKLVGDVTIDNPRLGTLQFEDARADRITLQAGLLNIEDIHFRNRDMEATGQVSIPLAEEEIRPRADLHVSNGQFAPVAGMTPYTFDADLHLEGNKLYLGQARPEPGAAPPPAGVIGKAGAGSFSARGDVELHSFSPARLSGNRFNIAVALDAVDLVIPGLVKGKLQGSLLLVNDPENGRPLLTTPTQPEAQPLVLSRAVLGPPEGRLAARAPLPFAPELNIWVLVGEGVRFRYGTQARPTEVRVEPGRLVPTPTGYLHMSGRATANEITIDAQGQSHQGVLSFPNGNLDLRSGEARLRVEAGQTRISVAGAEADGRVGDYYVSLSPAGEIYASPGPEQGPLSRRLPSNGASAPGLDKAYIAARLARGEQPRAPGYRLNAVSIPHLEEGYIMALLAGPVLAPTLGGSRHITELLANPGTPGAPGTAITGFLLPSPASQLGLRQLAFDVALRGPTRLRVGERLFRRVLVSYVSPLSGPPESRTFRITYEVTPRWSLGWGVSPLEQVRWEAQALLPF